MIEVPLRYGVGDRRLALLREVCGDDERFVASQQAWAAAELIDRLLLESPMGGVVVAGEAAHLCLSDLDRVVAALYVNLFGSRVEGRALCTVCAESFEASFSLVELQGHLDEQAKSADMGPDGAGYFLACDESVRFRLPTTLDIRAAKAAGGDEAKQVAHIAGACVEAVEPTVDVDPDRLQAAMQRVGPTLCLDIAAECVECGAGQSIPFDLREYFFETVRNEGAWRTREVHAIARAYGWSLAEILSLPRAERRGFVALIAGETKTRVGQSL